jgi:hypothetical protein
VVALVGLGVAPVGQHHHGVSVVLEDFDLGAETDDFLFHLFLGFVDLGQFVSVVFEVEGVGVQQVELLLRHVFVAFPFVGVEGVVLPESVA